MENFLHKLASLSLLFVASLHARDCDNCIEPCLNCCEQIDFSYAPSPTLDCSWGVSFGTEVLYWFSNETNNSYAISTITAFRNAHNGSVGSVIAPLDLYYLGNSWNTGLRLKLSFENPHSGWDLGAHWTYFRNTIKQKCATPSSAANYKLINPSLNPSFFLQNILKFTFVSASSHFQYNSFDIEVGNSYCPSSTFSLRPFIAGRLVYLKAKYGTFSYRTIAGTESSPFTYNEQFINSFKGGGIVFGIMPKWDLFECLSIYSNFDAALVWGKSKLKESESFFQVILPSNIDFKTQTSDSYYLMQGIIDTAIGVRSEFFCICEQLRIILDLGWEYHLWFDANQKMYDSIQTNFQENLPDLEIAGFRTVRKSTGNLFFGGFVAKIGLEF